VIRVDREIAVERPAPEVFDRLTRIEDLPSWQPAIVEARLETPSPIGLGSRVRLVVDTGGQRTVASGTVTAFERPSRLGLTAKAGSADLDAMVTITPTGTAACGVSLVTTIRLGGVLRFVEGIVRARVEAGAPEAAAAVKAWLEADAADPAAATAGG